ncbi:MAG TPA: hypothetical protein VI248_26905 [Kineosporiaceae bacterium]
MRSWLVACVGIALVAAGGRAATLIDRGPPEAVLGRALVVTLEAPERLPAPAGMAANDALPGAAGGTGGQAATGARDRGGGGPENEDDDDGPSTVAPPLTTLGPAWADPTPGTGAGAGNATARVRRRATGTPTGAACRDHEGSGSAIGSAGEIHDD